VDFPSHTLTVRQTKFSKSRIVVLHPSATKALEDYARARDRYVKYPRSPAFFLSDDGSAFTHKKALWAFRSLRRQLGWVPRLGSRLPRLYDLRHTFVCRRLLAWHRDGSPRLCRYAGYVDTERARIRLGVISVRGSRVRRYRANGPGSVGSLNPATAFWPFLKPCDYVQFFAVQRPISCGRSCSFARTST